MDNQICNAYRVVDCIGSAFCSWYSLNSPFVVHDIVDVQCSPRSCSLFTLSPIHLYDIVAVKLVSLFSILDILAVKCLQYYHLSMYLQYCHRSTFTKLSFSTFTLSLFNVHIVTINCSHCCHLQFSKFSPVRHLRRCRRLAFTKLSVHDHHCRRWAFTSLSPFTFSDELAFLFLIERFLIVVVVVHRA